MSVSIRKYPFPYKAALSICSDIDGTSFDDFLETQKFLITTSNTRLGKGLGIPIGNSFWMYDQPGIADSAFSYFSDSNGTLSSHAEQIRTLIKAGVLDVLHSYGNFAIIRDFKRDLAERAIEELDKHNLKIRVWTNHGGIESIQSIGALSSGMGDIPGAAQFYHSDLMCKYGIIFYWDSEYALMTNVGQDSPARFGDAYWNSPLYRVLNRRFKYTVKGILTLADKVSYRIRKKTIIHWQPFDPKENALLKIDVLRDNNMIYKFRRFGHGYRDDSDDLPMIINRSVLKRLVTTKGSCVVYIHMGDRNKSKSSDLPLSNASIRALRSLAEYYDDGIIWIAPTSKLLMYSLIRDRLNYSVDENSRELTIHIKSVNINTPNFQPSVHDLGGLTFFVPAEKKVQIKYQNEVIPSIKNPIDQYGRSSVGIPIPQIEWPF